jgi:rare lipoprotein A
MRASYYGAAFQGHPTANGEIFNRHAWTAAHRTLPFGSILRVTYPITGRTVTVRINDRGPFIRGRDLDLAEGAAARLGMRHAGVAKVRVRRIG